MLSTSNKIRIARSISTAILWGRGLFHLPSELIAVRRGVTWSIDLKEGIDLAIYVLGGFEVQTLKLYARLVNEGDVVLDIGANIGAHTLPLAQLVGARGKVFSFEPTAFAFRKQKANIALNPMLSPRISAHQMMLMATTDTKLPDAVYSSWPLENTGDLHVEHHGRLMGTVGAAMSTLDEFVAANGIDRIDFVKLDVDGNESDVLLGSKATIEKYQPKILLELAPYVYKSQPEKFDAILNSLWSMGYEISDVARNRKLPRNPDFVRSVIPTGGGLNVLATRD
ncbi:FkbM family methyltransferase [Rhizobium binae]|uniref:FkbM family methyltransferase n=1 Tax=Rhizobium binae TaxID=1138190 RepID=UPI001C83014E|nr:FkbM family methyltransferase [Rhizobium binae]MBX4950229.1 FkbM family methyltransferase [Rhizobium binae]